MNGYEEIRGKLFELEERVKVNAQSSKTTRTLQNDKTENTLMSALSGTNLERDQLRQIEKKIAKRVTESVEQLGDIIKDYATKQKRIDTRMTEVEAKVFGRTKAFDSKKSEERKYSSIKKSSEQPLQSSGISLKNSKQNHSFKRKPSERNATLPLT